MVFIPRPGQMKGLSQRSKNQKRVKRKDGLAVAGARVGREI